MRKLSRPTQFPATAEGRTWELVALAIQRQEYILTVRRIAILAGLGIGTVSQTMAWKIYVAARAAARADGRSVCAARVNTERWRKCI